MSTATINYLKQLRKSIEKLSKWETSGKAFGFIKTVPDTKDNYIYEFFCAMKVLEDLSISHAITLEPSPHNRQYKFPLKPGSKKNWARFLIKDNKSAAPIAQLCLGTEIKISTSPKTTFGSDISFQTPSASEDPDEKEVILIMDAKYKSDSKKRMNISTIREFAQCVHDMDAPKAQKSTLKFTNLIGLDANCLFTNGLPDDKHESYCKQNKMKQVGTFDYNKKMQVVG